MGKVSPLRDERNRLLALYPQLAWFTYDHLSPRLAEVSRQFSDLAWAMARDLPRGSVERDQIRRCLEHLEEAKDCAVRARVGRPQPRIEDDQGEEVRGD